MNPLTTSLIDGVRRAEDALDERLVPCAKQGADVPNGWRCVYGSGQQRRVCCFVGNKPLCGQSFTISLSDRHLVAENNTCPECDRLNDGLWAIVPDAGDDDIPDVLALETRPSTEGEL